MNFEQDLKNEIFNIISDIAYKNSLEAYVIGGFVRDLILKRETKDIDIVTIGSGIELANSIANKLGNDTKVVSYKNFGTAMLWYNGLQIEFVGARKESYNRNSRNPIVEDATLDEDISRRDFTINAMAISLNSSSYGDLVDVYNGIDDLDKKIIKTPLEPNITYSDDPLRMLRAIRFATQLNFTIEKNSFDAIKNNADRINIISKERIVEELNKILVSKKPSIGFNLLDQTGILEHVFPQLCELKGIDVKDGWAHKDNFKHTLEVLDNIALTTDNLWLRWAALLHDIAKPRTKHFNDKTGWTFHGHENVGANMIPKIFKQLKLPLNEKMKYVQKLVNLHLRPIAIVSNEVTDSATRRLLFEAGDDIEDLMLLCEADITSKNSKKVKRFLENFKIVRQKLKEIEEKDSVRNFQPPVNGNIISETFEITHGKQIGNIKDFIKESILDGIIGNNYKEAYELMLRKGEELGLKVKKK